MNLILITGPQAVGKMTVGLEIEKKLGYRVFHNHMTIEPVIRLFDYGTKEAQHLIHKFREEIFNAMITSGNRGYIFTYVWDFDADFDNDYVRKLIDLFEGNNHKVLIVELESDVETRLSRNDTELRLQEKPSKRNVEWSAGELVKSMDKHRLNSKPGEIRHDDYLRINNQDLTAEEAADMIIEYFKLK